jgi:hypothetical protein
MAGWNVTDCVSGVVTKVGKLPGIAVVFYDKYRPPPLENHITPSPCILKEFDIIYMWLVVIWL